MLHEILIVKVTMHARATLCLDLESLIYDSMLSHIRDQLTHFAQGRRICQIFADIIYEWPLNP